MEILSSNTGSARFLPVGFRELRNNSQLLFLPPQKLGYITTFESRRIAVDGGMAHIAARDHVDHVLGNIGSVVGDALQIFGHQDQLKLGKYDGLIARHVAEQLTENLIA